MEEGKSEVRRGAIVVTDGTAGGDVSGEMGSWTRGAGPRCRPGVRRKVR